MVYFWDLFAVLLTIRVAFYLRGMWGGGGKNGEREKENEERFVAGGSREEKRKREDLMFDYKPHLPYRLMCSSLLNYPQPLKYSFVLKIKSFMTYYYYSTSFECKQNNKNKQYLQEWKERQDSTRKQE